MIPAAAQGMDGRDFLGREGGGALTALMLNVYVYAWYSYAPKFLTNINNILLNITMTREEKTKEYKIVEIKN